MYTKNQKLPHTKSNLWTLRSPLRALTLLWPVSCMPRKELDLLRKLGKEGRYKNKFIGIQMMVARTSLYGCFKASAVQCLNSTSASVFASVHFTLYIECARFSPTVGFSNRGIGNLTKEINDSVYIKFPWAYRFYSASFDLNHHSPHTRNRSCYLGVICPAFGIVQYSRYLGVKASNCATIIGFIWRWYVLCRFTREELILHFKMVSFFGQWVHCY